MSSKESNTIEEINNGTQDQLQKATHSVVDLRMPPSHGSPCSKSKIHPSPEPEDTKPESLDKDKRFSIHVDTGNLLHSPSTPVTSIFDQFDVTNRDGQRSKWRIRICKFMESIPFTIASIIFTILILYMDLIRQAALPPSADPFFTAWAIFAITALFSEVTLSSMCRPGYFPKFYFWMDLIASISLLCDIPGFTEFITFYTDDDSNRHVTLERAAKGLQAAARAARIMQVIAAAQLLRIRAKRRLQSLKSGRSTTDDGLSRMSSTGDDEPNAVGKLTSPMRPQSRIGEKVTEMTMRKVTLGVLIIILVLPVFDPWVFYGKPSTLEKGGLGMLHDLYQTEGNSSGFLVAKDTYIEENAFKAGTKTTGYVFRLKIWNTTVLDSDPHLRDVEWQTSTIKTPACSEEKWSECFESKVWINVKWEVQMQALLDIGRVTFILTMLSVGAILFIRDTDQLVLQPIERMITKVKNISRNPLAAAHNMTMARTKSKSQKQLETRVLEHSIGKICSLLSVGFGEAGAEVISDNMRSGGDLNPMVPGQRVHAIFGFCDIRQFTDATEVLQEGVMEFVNSIATIVHTEVAHHGGSANKNIGDAFLLVWKLPRTATEAGDRVKRSSILGARLVSAESAFGLHSETVTHLADAALASFIVIQAALKRSKKVHEYSKREDLNARMANFEVRMGFGLHVGWAIEGAIGSHHKIDASYLSPHVNTASRLEAATKQFGVPLLFSEAFVNLLSPSVRARCRQIDCVSVKGSAHPIGLYTYDMDTSAIGLEGSSSVGQRDADMPRDSVQLKKPDVCGSGCEYVSFSDYPYFNEFEEHPDITSTRTTDLSFLKRFDEGFQAYKDGDWVAAIKILEEVSSMRRTCDGEIMIDGPSMALIEYMKSMGCRAPTGWAGHRELTEK